MTAQFGARYAAAKIATAGLVLVGIGLALMLVIDVDSSWTAPLPGLLVTSFGTGLFNPTGSALALNALPDEQSGLAAGANDTFRQTGVAVGSRATPCRAAWCRFGYCFSSKALLLQPRGRESLIPSVEVLLADDPAGPKAVEREKRSVHCNAAALSLPGCVSGHKHPVPGVDHLLEMNLHLPGVVQCPPHLTVALMAAIHALQVGESDSACGGPSDLDIGVIAAKS